MRPLGLRLPVLLLAAGCAHAPAPQRPWVRLGQQVEVTPIEPDAAAKEPEITQTEIGSLTERIWNVRAPGAPLRSTAPAAVDGVQLDLQENLEPSGEVNNAGFWLHLDRGGGKEEQLYTGLTRYRPLILYAGGGYPKREGDFVVAIGRWAPLQEERLRHPPTQIPLERQEQLLLVRLDLRELRRDSDGDGLTDLQERRLLTSATSPDTDGDGRSDAEDVNPLVKLVEATPTHATLLRDELLRRHLSKARNLVLLVTREPFDLPSAPFKLLTLYSYEAEKYQRAFGYRQVCEMRLGGCGDTPCEINKWGNAQARHELTESDVYAIASFSGGYYGDYYAARWNGKAWELESRGGVISRR